MTLKEIELQQSLDRRDARILELEKEALAYSYEGNNLNLNDKMVLKAPENDMMFFNSNLGKEFESGKVDVAFLTVLRKEWGEYYFSLTFELNGKPCININMSPEEYSDDSGYSKDEQNGIYTEEGGYQFARYFLSKGAQINP